MATAIQYDDMSDDQLAECAIDESHTSLQRDLLLALGDRIIDLSSEVGKLQYRLDKKET